MAYRVEFKIDQSQVRQLQALGQSIDQSVAPIVKDALNLIQQYAVQNLSGVPFSSETGNWTIQKRTGKGAASVQVQYPYGSPFKGRVFASAMTRYADNPEEYNYLAILEYGRGEVKPRYTPSMNGGDPGAARLAIPGGPFQLVGGQNGFRGITGRYRFVKSLKPMTGRRWMQAAVESATPEIPGIISDHLSELLGNG